PLAKCRVVLGERRPHGPKFPTRPQFGDLPYWWRKLAMSLRFPMPLRFLIALVATAALVLPAVPAMAQGTGTSVTTTMISIDSPADGATVTNGTQVDVGGWAADSAGPGTGVDMVRVYLDGRMDAGGTLAGNANYGGSRPDVATALGSSNYTNSGFD